MAFQALADQTRPVQAMVISCQEDGRYIASVGEAPMARKQSHLVLEKFAETGKYALNWGRLHLKWDEALHYSGHEDLARIRFKRHRASI
jgi:hypothetical protein